MRQYLDLVESVLSTGTYKPNRTGVDTISAFSRHYDVDLAEGYPLLTTKRMDGYRWNSMLHELAWYLSGDEHIRELREETRIWDAWADDRGRLDTAYGRFWRRFPIPSESEHLDGESWPDDANRWVDVEKTGDGGTRRVFDQLQCAIDTLKESPSSRRIVINAWHPANAAVSTLPPCHYSFVFNVQGDRLNCHLTQRSGDVALGIPFNIAAYALLTKQVAREIDLEPGTFAHTIVDAHVYCGTGERGRWYAENMDDLRSRVADVTDPDEYREIRSWIEATAPGERGDDVGLDHVPNLLEQCSRDPLERPTLAGDASVDDFTPEDVELRGYDAHDGLNFSVAE